MTARKLDALLRNYEHTHVIEELRSWLDDTDRCSKNFTNTENYPLFKFKMAQIIDSPLPKLSRTVSVDCLVIEQAALKHKYLPSALQATFEKGLDEKFDRLYNFVNKDTGRSVPKVELPKGAKISTRITELPDTLFMSINRSTKEGILDTRTLQCPKTIDFKWDGYKALLSPNVQPRRYSLVGVIVGLTKFGKNQVHSKDFNFKAFAVVRCPRGMWYRVDNAEGLREPSYHGVLMDSAQVGKLLHPDGVVEACGFDTDALKDPGVDPSKLENLQETFVMRLYYRSMDAVLAPVPFRKEADMEPYPESFIGLFDRGALARDNAMVSLMGRATESIMENHCVDMTKLMGLMPPLDEPLCEPISGTPMCIGVGPGNKTPEAILALLDLRPDTLIGRTVFEVFRVRSLLAVFKKYFSHSYAKIAWHEDATAKGIVAWAVREWRTLPLKQKEGWILVADYFNMAFSDRLALEIKDVDRKRPQRISAFTLFVEQWPVLVGKKLSCDLAEDVDDPNRAATDSDPFSRDVVMEVDDKAVIAGMVANQELMNDIWNEMDPSAKATFAELARWRYDLFVCSEQGTYEVWERLPFHGPAQNELSDDAVVASVIRLDLVSKAKVEDDPRVLQLDEFRNTSAPKPKTLANAHVQLAMVEESANPYVHYSSDNYELSVDSCTARFPKDKRFVGDPVSSKTPRISCLDVAPFVDIDGQGKCAGRTSIKKMLDVQSSHVNFGWEEKNGIAHCHRVTNTPDTVAIRVTPWTQKLVHPAATNKYAPGNTNMEVNYELTPEPDKRGCLVNVSFPEVIDASAFQGHGIDGKKILPLNSNSIDQYELVGIVAIERPKPFKTELVSNLPAHGKITRAEWNALGSGKDQTASLVTDAQREQVYKLVEFWGKEDAAGKPPPAYQRLHVSSSQLDAMLRAATGVLRLSLGRVETEPGETTERAVQECVERTMINLFSLREHYISQQLWQTLFDIINGGAPCPPDAINKQLCAVMKQLREPTDHEWRVAKELRQAPVSKSEAVYLITRYLGQGTSFLGSVAAKESLPIDAVCKTNSEDETPFACMIPPAKRTRYWHRIMREFRDGWWHFESGDEKQQKGVALPATITAGLDKEMNEHSVVFYYRRVENWQRETAFIERLESYDRGYTKSMIESRFQCPRRPERSLRLMAQSPFLRRELYNVAVHSMRASDAERSLLQFMGWLTLGVGQEQETAIRMIFDPNVRRETFESFLCSKAYSKKGVAGFYVKANKTKKVSALVSGDDGDAQSSPPELTEEEREQLALEHAKELKRKWVAEAEARARREALEAERRERERVAAEEAAAAEAAIRERLAADAAERAVRAAEEAEAARQARLARQERDAAQQEARDAARRTKESDEQAKKKALAKQKSEEKKAAKAANKDRKKATSAIKLEDERKKKHSEEVATLETEAKAAAKAAEAKAAARRAARAAAAAPLQAEADARTAAAEARAAARAAERAAERAASLEADELAEQTEFELAEEWAAEQTTEAPPSSPMSTSTAASTAPSSAWTHGASDVDAQCVICFEGVRDHLCLPCKHLCICARCVSGTSLTTCPMCRQPVEEIINIFW